jgi:hypothetical protein
MRYYITRHNRCAPLVENIDPWDAMSLYYTLARAGVFEDPLTFNRLSFMVERALWQGAGVTEIDAMLADVEQMLVKLGVLPSHESILSDQPDLAHVSSTRIGPSGKER